MLQSADLSEEVRCYQKMVEAHARRFARLPLSPLPGHDMRNEYDDFVQEGLISVWEALLEGHTPGNVVVMNAMRDHARHVRRRGFGGFEELTEGLEG